MLQQGLANADQEENIARLAKECKATNTRSYIPPFMSSLNLEEYSDGAWGIFPTFLWPSAALLRKTEAAELWRGYISLYTIKLGVADEMQPAHPIKNTIIPAVQSGAGGEKKELLHLHTTTGFVA
jgi:hypothetical protein